MNKIKPVWVKVLWSESPSFNDNELIYFPEFEKKSSIIAHRYLGKGYLKTKIIVLFDSGDQFECRLDLSENDTHNFAHYLEKLIVYWDKKDSDNDNYRFYKKIEVKTQ